MLTLLLYNFAFIQTHYYFGEIYLVPSCILIYIITLLGVTIMRLHLFIYLDLFHYMQHSTLKLNVSKHIMITFRSLIKVRGTQRKNLSIIAISTWNPFWVESSLAEATRIKSTRYNALRARTLAWINKYNTKFEFNETSWLQAAERVLILLL